TSSRRATAWSCSSCRNRCARWRTSLPKGVRHLRLGDVVYIVATILLGVAGALVLTGAVGIILQDGSAMPLLASAAIAAAGGVLGRRFTHVPDSISFREAFATVTFAWTAIALVGALPFVLS